MVRALPPLACLLLALLLGGSSCSDDKSPCNECFSRMALYIRPSASDPLARFQTGNYAIDAVIDGSPSVCSFTVVDDRTTHTDCSNREVLAGTDLIFFSIPGTPEQVEITLSRAGSPLFSDTYIPVYIESDPGGEECGPPCEAASEEAFVLP